MGSSATYTQLRDGSWGIRVPGTAAVNQQIAVTKKSGETKTETVEKVLWSGKDSKSGQTVSLCAIARSEGAAERGHGRGNNACDECGRPGASVPCHDSSGIGGMCCRRCASLPSYERSFA